ncbi:IS66 family insertion sequence element accessory protein TnpB [Trinickia mobilis]|uniref:IS66 family insertion sequence element accessory protein TnpB n=1 Tax=Trinickia mobilis TaxID=2816356 RepID=UPI001A8EA9AE|nr:IS66 family insertion sequence element accessory protein TnpB [Trinickia mobilis]
MIRIDKVGLAVDPPDMRAGFDTALARVVKVFDAARPHHAYLFANRRANRMKALVHDGIAGRLGTAFGKGRRNTAGGPLRQGAAS